MGTMSEYELKRHRNAEMNTQVLMKLGLLDTRKKPIFTPKPVTKPKETVKRKRVPKKAPQSADNVEVSTEHLESCGAVRRSSRIKGKPRKKFRDMADEGEGEGLDSDYTYDYSDVSDNEEDRGRKRKASFQYVPKNRKNVVGAIPGIPIGKYWDTRHECSLDGVHRPTVAGIQGSDKEGGCYSIALSGGYADDVDFGEYFTYTGSGGRDLKGTKNKPKNLRTAPQSKDQVLEGQNLALKMNVKSKKPVRVIRGYKLKSIYAPDKGYRYDGLYNVERYWYAVGVEGFGICKYALRRCQDQDPPPWKYSSVTSDSSESEPVGSNGTHPETKSDSDYDSGNANNSSDEQQGNESNHDESEI